MLLKNLHLVQLIFLELDIIKVSIKIQQNMVLVSSW